MNVQKRLQITPDLKLHTLYFILYTLSFLAAFSLISCESGDQKTTPEKVEQPAGPAYPVYHATACSDNYPQGGFYPKDAQKLQELVDKFLKEAGTQDVPGKPIAVISPHAGYVFSGAVAAFSYKAIERLEPETVILVGPSHISGPSLRGASILTEGSFKNPLGTLTIDSETAKKIVAADPKLFRNELLAFKGPEKGEHCLEVQLPFLQRVLKKEFKIVMLLVNGENVSLTEKLGKAIADACAGKKVILIASSDLTHYPAYDAANEIDVETLNSFQTLEPEAILRRSRELLRKDVPQLHCTACGLAAIMTTVSAAKYLGADSIKLLKYANSGDVEIFGGREGVVGYGALVLYRATKESPISPEGQKTLLTIARDAIIAGSEKRPFQAKEGEGELAARRGVFVTLLIDGNLRGCIGDFYSCRTLPETVAQVAPLSAFHDTTRFPPVTKEEIAKIKIKISILTPLMPVDSPDKIVPGKHGIYIKDSQRRSATFLPEVATEQGWNLQTLLSECCKKGGMAPDAWKKPDTIIQVYTTQVFGEQ